MCVHDAAIDQAVELYYGDQNPSTPGSDLNRCQMAIGKATAAFFAAKTRALAKCYDARHGGKHGLRLILPQHAGEIRHDGLRQEAPERPHVGGFNGALGIRNPWVAPRKCVAQRTARGLRECLAASAS